MGDIKGFLEIKRQCAEYRPVCERVKDYKDVSMSRSESVSKEQASRCMDCGTPFCHWGCPVGNYIPEWNDLSSSGQWKKAYELLSATNNFPEITGRVCSAICEYACVLGINDEPVTIRENELAIIEHAFKEGWVGSNPPKRRSKKRVAILGSGPAGLACADELNKLGHRVFMFEKDDKIGGLLRYGIPAFKLERWILDRRLKILEKEGIEFRTNSDKVKGNFDAICIATGAQTPRDLKIKGRDLKGIYLAMDYLTRVIDTKGKDVVVIGGGDTGSDCVGTACRRWAKSITQIEILAKPPLERTRDMPWPRYPLLLRTSSSHEEGCRRLWSVTTERFLGERGQVRGLLCVHDGKRIKIDADLVILAVGFLKPDEKKFHKARNIFYAGDVQRGPSLVVRAISEGRDCAKEIDRYLKR